MPPFFFRYADSHFTPLIDAFRFAVSHVRRFSILFSFITPLTRRFADIFFQERYAFSRRCRRFEPLMPLFR